MPVIRIDQKNFDHLVDTARLVLREVGETGGGNARELAEIFLVFATRVEVTESSDVTSSEKLRRLPWGG